MTDFQQIVIADAGPLIHLDELGCLDLLEDFPCIWIAEAVWREVSRHRPSALSGKTMQRVQAGQAEARITALTLAFTLHVGEREALTLLMHHPQSLFITDDSAARLAALSLGARVHGSIGLIVRSIRRCQRDREAVVTLLRDIPARSSLHLRPGLLEEVIRSVQASGE